MCSSVSLYCEIKSEQVFSSLPIDATPTEETTWVDVRLSRSLANTAEGVMQPPGYFDNIVWPAYVMAHERLFVDRDVNGPVLDPTATLLVEDGPVDETVEKALRYIVEKL